MTLAKAREYTRQDNKKPRLYKRGLVCCENPQLGWGFGKGFTGKEDKKTPFV